MKKLMTLVLAVCMLLTAAAFAEAPVHQDEKAPEIIGAVTVYDAAGQVVKTITDPAELDYACVSARFESHDLYDLMHAAADCDFASKGFMAHEKFALLVDGAAMIEATFALEDWYNVDAVYSTADGTNWAPAEFTLNADRTITVKTVPGVVVFLSVAEVGAGALPTMTVTVESDNFTPSVSAKPAPVMVSCAIVDSKGNVVDDEKGVMVEITPVASRHYTKDINVYDKLTASFEEIMNAKSLSDLGLNGVDGMVVRDLFEVTMYGDALHGGIFNLEVTVEADAPDAVALKGDNGWKLIDSANIVDNGNGTITLKLDEVGTVAFLTAVAAQNAVNSPAT